MRFVFDTNVVIGAARSRAERLRFSTFLRARPGQVWLHGSVWLELEAGARTPADREALNAFVEPFVDTERVLIPSRNAWQQAGRVLARLAEERRVDVRRSSIHHDAVIAASARELGFAVVTRNLADFGMIAPYLRKLAFVPPYP